LLLSLERPYGVAISLSQSLVELDNRVPFVIPPLLLPLPLPLLLLLHPLVLLLLRVLLLVLVLQLSLRLVNVGGKIHELFCAPRVFGCSPPRVLVPQNPDSHPERDSYSRYHL
jgi:hypothetical protein